MLALTVVRGLQVGRDIGHDRYQLTDLSNIPLTVLQGEQHLTAKATRIAPGSPGMQNGHSNGSYDVLSQYAKTYAQQGGQQLKVLGEAGIKYLSGAVQTWRTKATAESESLPHANPGEQRSEARKQATRALTSLCTLYTKGCCVLLP